MRARRRQVGFTLVEVLIVVTIIGIAGAIVVPRMLGAGTLGIQAGARMVIADLLYAQNEAVVQQAVRGLVIDTDAEKYWMVDGADAAVPLNWRTGSGDNLVDFANDGRFRGVTLATVAQDGEDYAFTEDGGKLTFKFNELGEPSQGGLIGLMAGEQRFVVRIAPFTGRVTVEAVAP